MIASLQGSISDIQREYVVVNVSGVGYQVFLPASFIAELPAPGSEIQLTVYTDVKETDISLYGFRNTIDRQIFLFLKKVKGIGSKLAISILSSIESQKLLYAIATSDYGVLTKVPGVGKKSAERIIVELKERVQEFVNEHRLSDGESGIGRNVPELKTKIDSSLISNQIIEDATMALLALGFSEDASFQALSRVLDEKESAKVPTDPGEIVKKALAYFL